MSPMVVLAVLRVFRLVFSAFREAHDAKLPDDVGSEKAWRHVFAVNLVTEGMAALEKRLGYDIVQDSAFKAGVDLLLTGIRLIAESVIKARSSPQP